MAAAQTKGHEEDEHTGMQEKKKKRKKTSREQGTKASKQENRTQGVSIATNLPVSATKPRRGPCHTICHILPAPIGNVIKCYCCRCRAPRLCTWYTTYLVPGRYHINAGIRVYVHTIRDVHHWSTYPTNDELQTISGTYLALIIYTYTYILRSIWYVWISQMFQQINTACNNISRLRA